MKNLFLTLNLCQCALITLLAMSSCSVTEEDQDEGVSVRISTDKSQYTSYELVKISTDENISSFGQTLSGSINQLNVTLETEENSASFILPSLADGTYDLKVKVNGKDFSIPISVSNLTNIQSPDYYLNSITDFVSQSIANSNQILSELEEDQDGASDYSVLKKDISDQKKLMDGYMAAYQNLSNEDKLEFAKFFSANGAFLEEFRNQANEAYSASRAIGNTSPIDDYEEQVYARQIRFVSNKQMTIAHITALLATRIFMNPAFSPWVNLGATLAAGVIVGSFVIHAQATAAMGQQLIYQAVKPFELLTGTDPVIYNSGSGEDFSIQAKYRSLMESDLNDINSGDIIQSIVENYDNLKEKYNAFREKLPSAIRPSYVITSLRNTFKSATRFVHSKYLSVTSVSNPEVSVDLIGQPDGSAVLVATTWASSDQDFTYEISYTNQGFANNMTTRVKARVLADIDSTEIYARACLGSWTVYHFDPNNPTTVYTVNFNSDGTGLYEVDGFFYPTRWYILRNEDGYRFYEYGFWHFAYDTLERDALDYPPTGFKTYANFDPNFVSQRYVKN